MVENIKTELLKPHPINLKLYNFDNDPKPGSNWGNSFVHIRLDTQHNPFHPGRLFQLQNAKRSSFSSYGKIKANS